jgi:nitrate reductase NapD
MTICSLVVHTRPEKIKVVSAQLEELQGVEIHGRSKKGKIIVVIDHPERSLCSEAVMAMASMDGVVNASLVFEYQESENNPVSKTVNNNICLKEAS